MTKRKVFFISDRTGITAETLGGSLLTQFPKIQFTKTFIPFVTDVTSAKNAVSTIIEQTKVDGEDPIVFSTLTDPEILSIIATSSPNVFDLFGTFVGPLEKALESNSSRSAGKMHGISDTTAYETRLSALNFTLNHDDGLSPVISTGGHSFDGSFKMWKNTHLVPLNALFPKSRQLPTDFGRF